MNLEYGVGGYSFGLFEEESLQTFAVAVGNQNISADYFLAPNLPRLGAISSQP